MNNSFDIFKRLPNGNTLWITTVEGLVEAKRRMGRLAAISGGEYFVYLQGEGIVAKFSSSLELSHGASLIRTTILTSGFGGPHKASIRPDTTLRSPMCQVPMLFAVSKGSFRQRDHSPKNQCASTICCRRCGGDRIASYPPPKIGRGL